MRRDLGDVAVAGDDLQPVVAGEVEKVPASKLDQSLNLATWNVRELGKSARLPESIHYIAEILGQFDVIALTELRAETGDLERIMDVLGPTWRLVISDYNLDEAGNEERIGYLYDKRAATFTGLAAEADPGKTRQAGKYLSSFEWWRSPYMASFRAGNFDFILLTCHIRWGNGTSDRIEELTGLASWVHARANDPRMLDKDLIVMGDFNIPTRRSSTFKALTAHGLKRPAALATQNLRTNLTQDACYDQILHLATDERRFTDRAGVLDFHCGDHQPLFPGRALTRDQFTFQISDHLPLWIQVDCDVDVQRIEHALRG